MSTKNKFTDKAKLRRQGEATLKLMKKFRGETPPPPPPPGKTKDSKWLDEMMEYKPPAKKPRKPRSSSKKDLEAAVIKECKLVIADLGLFIWRQNTGEFALGDRYIRFGIAGQPDFIGSLPNGTFIGIEAKRRKGGRQSGAQKEFQAKLEINQGLYLLVRSGQELREKLEEYLQKHCKICIIGKEY